MESKEVLTTRKAISDWDCFMVPIKVNFIFVGNMVPRLHLKMDFEIQLIKEEEAHDKRVILVVIVDTF